MLIHIISALVNLYVILIFIYVLFSWFPHERGILSDIYKVLQSICEPYVGLFRKLIPPVGGLDFSPMAAMAVLWLLEWLLVRIVS
jgi:YggT family protein